MAFDQIATLLTLQVALLDHVSPKLRAVTTDFNENEDMLIIHFYYDGEIDDELFDLASCATVEADPVGVFPYSLNEDITIRLDFPNLLPTNEQFVYLREEPGCERYLSEKKNYNIPYPLANLALYMQQVLLGKIRPNLRRLNIGIDVQRKIIEFHFVFDGAISEEDRNLVEAISRDVNLSFPSFKCQNHVYRVDFPQRIPSLGEKTVYSRNEPDLE